MPKLRLAYSAANKSRGAKSKAPTTGCKSYAGERRGWKNKIRRLERHLKRVQRSYDKHFGVRTSTKGEFTTVPVLDVFGNVVGNRRVQTKRVHYTTSITRKPDMVALRALERSRLAVKGFV